MKTDLFKLEMLCCEITTLTLKGVCVQPQVNSSAHYEACTIVGACEVE